MKIRTGDTVIVTAGKDKGREGTVIAADPTRNRVTVEGVNIAKRHRKARSQEDPGGIIDMEKPIHVSNVMVKSPSDGKPTRVGYKVDGGTKVRVCKRTGAEIPEVNA